jgi:hypothetical protein
MNRTDLDFAVYDNVDSLYNTTLQAECDWSRSGLYTLLGHLSRQQDEREGRAGRTSRAHDKIACEAGHVCFDLFQASDLF